MIRMLSAVESHRDKIFYNLNSGFVRKSNHAGGLKGGMSNGNSIVVSVMSKSLPSLRKPLRSADTQTGMATDAQKERADVCVIPAAGVMVKMMPALVLADMRIYYRQYLERICRTSS